MKETFSLWTACKPFEDPADVNRTETATPGEDGICRVTDVVTPTLTYYPVSGKGPHPAILVCPGGGYKILAWNHEGEDICAYFNSIGFAAFQLKYRCPDQREAAHADAVRAMRFIRANAEKFNIDPTRLGAMGFSAGAHLTATLAAPANDVPYPPQDDIDTYSYRPDFTALIYPAYLADDDLNLAPEFNVNENTPPAFLLQSGDDPIRVENALGWYLALKRAGVKAEMHIYGEGGHGYGILRTGNPVSDWTIPAARWFREQGKIK
jgi:acetyl esterase/lipase